MKKILFVAPLVALAACSTSRTFLKNEKTGQIVTCGGNVQVGVIPYAVQNSSDAKCVDSYVQRGFKVQP
ncbi:UNVERIFIED_ORG: hypothetical protein LHK14_25295 (plasmid) [Roseateles sp. XES5]|nr:hypothetical protein [Roseateles sp. XES5]